MAYSEVITFKAQDELNADCTKPEKDNANKAAHSLFMALVICKMLIII
jgi:hypothetical protein